MVSHERKEGIVRFRARPGLDFNILRAAFMFEDHKSAKKDSQVVNISCTFGIRTC